MCGLSNPLTNASPSSAKGHFIEGLCLIGELSIGGAVIGLVGSHALIGEMVALLEGQSGEGEPQVQSEEERELEAVQDEIGQTKAPDKLQEQSDMQGQQAIQTEAVVSGLPVSGSAQAKDAG